MPPFALTDAQLHLLQRLAAPLAPPDRSAFPEAVAAKLAQQPELIGDDFIARIAAEAQRRLLTPRAIDGTKPRTRAGKYRRRNRRHRAPRRARIPLLTLF